MTKFIILLFSVSSVAVNISGNLAYTFALYRDDDNEQSQDMWSRPELQLALEHRLNNFDFKFSGYSRYDFQDKHQKFNNIEDLWVSFSKNKWNLRLGWQTLNWTVSEAFQPADIINSRHAEGNVENFPRIGELMARLQFRVPKGRLTFFYMPYLTDPRFPPSRSRLGSNIQIHQPRWIDGSEAEDDNWNAQYAARLTQTWNALDFAISYVDHMDRQNPLFAASTSGFTPTYFRKQQTALTATYVYEAWLFKFEGAYRNYDQEQAVTGVFGAQNLTDHGQYAFGAEYFYDYESGSEGQFIAELQTIQGANYAQRLALNAFQRDIHLAYRHSLNDVDAKQFLVSFITDIERPHQYLVNATYSQRLDNHWKISTGLRYVDAPIRNRALAGFPAALTDAPVGIEVYHQDHQIYGKLAYFF